MKKLYKYSLQQDVYEILRENKLLSCNGGSKEDNYIERTLENGDTIKYLYPNRQLMMDDHYEISKLIFKLRA